MPPPSPQMRLLLSLVASLAPHAALAVQCDVLEGASRNPFFCAAVWSDHLHAPCALTVTAMVRHPARLPRRTRLEARLGWFWPPSAGGGRVGCW
eukprot:COSAG01_NODE_5226_length_4401_cov_5.008601_2_plen_94_part_00